MLRFTGAIGSCLAALVVVPTAAFGTDDAGALTSVRTALARTVQALELLTGIRDRTESGERLEVQLVREITEPPMFGEDSNPERDRKMEILRTQVGLLQEELDLVETRLLEGDSPEATVARPPAGSGVTHGLDPAALEGLRRIATPAPTPSTDVANPIEREVSGTPYSANPLLQAQACYRAGLYARGLDLLEAHESVAARYWSARCLEGLDRLEEAEEIYRTIASRDDAGSFAERARTNLEFVAWKRQFVEKLPQHLKATKEGSDS